MRNDGFVPMGDTIQVRIDDDVVCIRNFRYMTIRDLHAVTEAYARVRIDHGIVFALYDVTHSQGIERDARKEMTKAQVDAPHADATAVFGASFAIRTLSNMLERALVGLGRPSTGIRFFETEDQARAYLNQQRISLQKKG